MPVNILPKILDSCIKCTSARPEFKLVESKNRGKPNCLSQVVVERLSHNSLCMNVDIGGQWSVYHCHTGDFNKRCDYVIYTNLDGKKYLIFIELKSSNINETDIILKFKATDCFFSYCNMIAKIFYGCSFFPDMEKRFVVVHKPLSIAKKPTNIIPKAINDIPEKYRKIEDNHRNRIPIRKLL